MPSVLRFIILESLCSEVHYSGVFAGSAVLKSIIGESFLCRMC